MVANVHNNFALSFENTAIFKSIRDFMDATAFGRPKGISKTCIDVIIADIIIKSDFMACKLGLVSRIDMIIKKKMIGIERGSPV